MTPLHRKRLLWGILGLNVATLLVLLLWPFTCMACDGAGKIEISKRLRYSETCVNCGGRKRLTVGTWTLLRTGLAGPVKTGR